MAAKTVILSQSDNGAFIATLVFDDVTLICSTVNYDLTAGTAEVVYGGVTHVPLPGGVGKSVPVPGSRVLGPALDITFLWKAA